MTDSARATAPSDTADFAGDRLRYGQFWQTSEQMLGQLPAKPKRDAAQAEAAERIKGEAREARRRFLRAHARTVYDTLTRNRATFVRAEQLVYDAATLVPGLTPTRAQV